METVMSLERSTGPWYVDGRYVRQRINSNHLVARTFKPGDAQLIAAAPVMAAALKMVLSYYADADPENRALVAATIALTEAGEL